jgi:DNA-binding transcriptional LysR family regulator
MSLAAAELGVTYGAVSRQIRGLEDRLGIVLFDGPRNKLVPTQAAYDLHPALQEAFDTIETAVNRTVQKAKRPLLVSCLSTFAMRWLIPKLFNFQHAYPNIDVRMTADDGAVDFRRDPYDVAIRVGPGPWSDSKATALFAEKTGFVISPRLLTASHTLNWAQLEHYPILHTKTRRYAWRDWSRKTGRPTPTGGREFEHFYFMIEAATAGLGMAIVPEVLVAEEVRGRRLVAPFGFELSDQEYVALTGQNPSHDAQAFVDWLVSQSHQSDPPY